jgi:hypothetical protein
MKIYQAVQKLLEGDRHTHRQTGDLISLLSFLESRLIKILPHTTRDLLSSPLSHQFSQWTISSDVMELGCMINMPFSGVHNQIF